MTRRTSKLAASFLALLLIAGTAAYAAGSAVSGEPLVVAVGRVVDDAGDPVAGATVALKPAWINWSPDLGLLPGVGGRMAPAEVATGDDGRFRFDDVPAGHYDLAVRAAGFALLRVRGLAATPPPAAASAAGTAIEVDLGVHRLGRGGVIAGRVVNTAGEPVRGAAVSQFLFGAQRGALPVAVSSEDGRFRVMNVPESGYLVLSIEAPGFMRALHPLSLPAVEPLEVTVTPRVRLSGTVAPPPAGGELGRAWVEVDGDGLSERLTVLRDGRFFVSAPPGVVRLTAIAENHAPSPPLELQLEPGEDRKGLRLELSEGAIVEGRVLYASGKPVPAHTVWLLEGAGSEKPEGYGFEMLARLEGRGQTTDAEGRFRFDAVPLGRHRFEVTNSGMGQVLAPRQLDVRPGRQRLDLRVTDGGDLQVRVVDESGRPLVHSWLSVWKQRDDGSNRQGDRTTNSDGSAELEDLPPGDYVVCARHATRASACSEIFPLESGGGAEVAVVLSPGARLEGRLVGLDPADLALVKVSLGTAWSDPWTPDTDLDPRLFEGLHGVVSRDGTYVLENAPAGRLRLRASRPLGWAGRWAQLEVGGAGTRTAVDFDFSDRLVLSGRVLRGGAPVHPVSAVLECSSAWAAYNGLADGSFVFRGLPPERCRLRVSSHVGRSEQWIELDGDREVEITLPPEPTDPSPADPSPTAPSPTAPSPTDEPAAGPPAAP